MRGPFHGGWGLRGGAGRLDVDPAITQEPSVTFVKAVWRFIVGVKDVLVLCFLLLFLVS